MRKIEDIVGMCDSLTREHQKRVSILSVRIGQQMALTPSQIENIRIAGMLHDIGKTALPAELLTKTEALNPFERTLIMNHPQVGYEMLMDLGLPINIIQSTQQHHERVDGSGYPSNLMGNQILLEARVVSVASVVDAMSCYRPYSPAPGIDCALSEITRCRGTHYDPAVVDACIRAFLYPMETYAA